MILKITGLKIVDLMLKVLNLDSAVKPREIAASTDAPSHVKSYVKKALITNKVTTNFFTTPITPLATTLSTSSTAESRLKLSGSIIILSLAILTAACNTLPAAKQVTLSHGIDESAGGVSAYVVSISNGTFYLEKEGGGLSSMLDLDGVDWLGFNDTKGSGWKGEYRGFPNAIHKQDGNYFHAMNAGTEKSTSQITIETAQHVQIIFTSGNGKWQGQWDFYPERLDFTMTKVSEGYHYWVQYEGVPGGEMDTSDFWYNSADVKAHPINEEFRGDLPAPEWFAFGDKKAPRMIYFLHHEDDAHPDDYVSRPYMTVLGFGRSEKNKYLNKPQTFSIGFVESTSYNDIDQVIKNIIN